MFLNLGKFKASNEQLHKTCKNENYEQTTKRHELIN